MKHNNTRRDPKSPVFIKSASGQLATICRLINARCLLLPHSPVRLPDCRDVICSECFESGHTCRSSLCPKNPVKVDQDSVVYRIANYRLLARNKRPTKRVRF
jgi:hypothetical protein